MTNEDRDLSSSANKNQGYNRSQQQHSQQVSSIDPELVHGCPVINMPYFTFPLTPPYVMHPGYYGPPLYFTNQDSKSQHENVSVLHCTNNTNIPVDHELAKTEDESDKNVQTASPSTTPAVQENAGYIVMPFFPGQALLPFSGHIPQQADTVTVRVETQETCEDGKN